MDKGLIIHSVVLAQNKILILKRSKQNDVLSGYWDIPGGTLENGEDPVAGAIREAQEESGLSLDNLGLFYYTSNVDQSKNKQFVRLIFLATTNDNLDKVTVNPEEHSEFRWVDFNEIGSYQVVDYLIPCIDYLKNKKHPLFQLT
ncbi:MAG: NUDIX hydrolase [Candidatus Buchananbacteria bacterium]